MVYACNVNCMVCTRKVADSTSETTERTYKYTEYIRTTTTTTGIWMEIQDEGSIAGER